MGEHDLLMPLDGDLPCGPDLERNDDDAFVAYYFEAEARLPERYFISGSPDDGRGDRVFDPRSVDLPSETRAITALLARSRDLRLLALLARFQALAARPAEFATSIETMTALLERWPDDVHPQRDTGERRGVIDLLNSQTAVIMPLMHLPLLPNADVTLRHYLVASGKASPRLSEADLPGQDVLEPLRAEANIRHVVAIHASLTRIAEALFALQRQALSSGVTADLSAVRGVVGDLLALIASARPDLRVWVEPATGAAPESPPEAAPAGASDDPAPAPQQSAVIRPVANRATAAAALDIVQQWLARHQPSSPSLILVAQARQLVGVPLIQALEILMPDRAPTAVLAIGQGSGFSLPMDRLRELTQVGLDGRDLADDPAVQPQPISNRGDLLAQILGVEGYFTAAEPASPIPLLLSKARSMLDARFDAVVAELLIPATSLD